MSINLEHQRCLQLAPVNRMLLALQGWQVAGGLRACFHFHRYPKDPYLASLESSSTEAHGRGPVYPLSVRDGREYALWKRQLQDGGFALLLNHLRMFLSLIVVRIRSWPDRQRSGGSKLVAASDFFRIGPPVPYKLPGSDITLLT